MDRSSEPAFSWLSQPCANGRKRASDQRPRAWTLRHGRPRECFLHGRAGVYTDMESGSRIVSDRDEPVSSALAFGPGELISLARQLRIYRQQLDENRVRPAKAVLNRVFTACSFACVANVVLLDELAGLAIDARVLRDPPLRDPGSQVCSPCLRSPSIAIHCSGAQPFGASHCSPVSSVVVARPCGISSDSSIVRATRRACAPARGRRTAERRWLWSRCSICRLFRQS